QGQRVSIGRDVRGIGAGRAQDGLGLARIGQRERARTRVEDGVEEGDEHPLANVPMQQQIRQGHDLGNGGVVVQQNAIGEAIFSSSSIRPFWRFSLNRWAFSRAMALWLVNVLSRSRSSGVKSLPDFFRPREMIPRSSSL